MFRASRLIWTEPTNSPIRRHVSVTDKTLMGSFPSLHLVRGRKFSDLDEGTRFSRGAPIPVQEITAPSFDFKAIVHPIAQRAWLDQHRIMILIECVYFIAAVPIGELIKKIHVVHPGMSERK